MITIGNVLRQTMPNMILDSEIVDEYLCPGCDESVTLIRLTMPLGPKKGERVTLSCGCRCEDLAMARQVRQRRDELRRERLFQLFDQNSLINDALKTATFESYHPSNEHQARAKTAAIDYAEKFSKDHPRNLILSGSYGVGKSHLAVSIIKSLMKHGWTGLFISVPRLLTKLKATYNRQSEQTEDQLLSVLEEVDCLVLDDIGAEYASGSDHGGSWAASKVFEVVDSRSGKHTVFTTNLSAHELQDRVGPRNFSRMMYNARVVRICGDDYRLNAFA